jgi:hypothetical protein
MPSGVFPEQDFLLALARLLGFGGERRRQNASACIDNVASRVELALLRQIGMQFLTGSAIEASAKPPSVVRPLSFESVAPGPCSGEEVE